MAELNIDKMAHNVAEKALDEFLYDGKSIREWMQIIASEDCISRQAAMDGFGLSEKTRKYGGDHSGYDTIMKYEIQDVLEDLPPVTPQPKTGHWIVWNTSSYDWTYKCDKCGSISFMHSNYCPNCGAKMIEPQKSEDEV